MVIIRFNQLSVVQTNLRGQSSREQGWSMKWPSQHSRPMPHDLMSCSVFLLVSPAFLCPFCCSTKGENNEGGRCSVWPDNVKVFKRGNEEVSVLTCEGGPLSALALSVHSNPCPAAQHSDRAAVTACRPVADLHTPCVPKRAGVSLCQPPWSDALLRQLKAAQGHRCVQRWSLNSKQRPNRRHPAALRKADESFLPNCESKVMQFVPSWNKWHHTDNFIAQGELTWPIFDFVLFVVLIHLYGLHTDSHTVAAPLWDAVDLIAVWLLDNPDSRRGKWLVSRNVKHTLYSDDPLRMLP